MKAIEAIRRFERFTLPALIVSLLALGAGCQTPEEREVNDSALGDKFYLILEGEAGQAYTVVVTINGKPMERRGVTPAAIPIDAQSFDVLVRKEAESGTIEVVLKTLAGGLAPKKLTSAGETLEFNYSAGFDPEQAKELWRKTEPPE